MKKDDLVKLLTDLSGITPDEWKDIVHKVSGEESPPTEPPEPPKPPASDDDDDEDIF